MTQNAIRTETSVTRPVGVPMWAMIALAALAVPRVILHDLHLIPVNGPIVWLLALGPLAVWSITVIALKVAKPFPTLVVVGAIFGVLLVLTHQLLWTSAYQGQLPVVAGSTILPRLAAVVSGMFTGTIMGAVSGLVAWGLQTLVGRNSQGRGSSS